MAHSTGTIYLCLGHPAWPGNLDVRTAEEAQAWLDEHKGTHPGVYVDVVQTIRTPFTGVAPEPMRPVDEVRREHLDSVIEVLTSTLRFVEGYGHIAPQAVPGWRMAIDNLKTIQDGREVTPASDVPYIDPTQDPDAPRRLSLAVEHVASTHSVDQKDEIAQALIQDHGLQRYVNGRAQPGETESLRELLERELSTHTTRKGLEKILADEGWVATDDE